MGNVVQHKRPIVEQEVSESQRPRAEVCVSLVLWEDLQTWIFSPAAGFSASTLWYVLLLGVPMRLQLRVSFGMTTGTHSCPFSQPFVKDEESVK